MLGAGEHEPYTVLIADDDLNYRAALATVIEREPSLRLIGVARGATEAISLALELKPELVLVDVRMGGGGGQRVARELTRAGAAARVVALSAYDDYATVMQMLDSGAVGYILKGSSVESLVDGIVRAAGGLRDCEPSPMRSPHAFARAAQAVRDEPLRVLLADDNRNLLTELADVLALDARLRIVGLAAHAAEAVSLAAVHQPHVALVDWRIPGGGTEIVSAIRDRSPSTRIIGISAVQHPHVAMAMLRAGASGFIAKPIPPKALIETLHAAAAGHMPLAPELSAPIFEQLVAELQDREREMDQRAVMRERVQAAMQAPVRMAYQPIVSLHDNEPVAVEALARFSLEPCQVASVWFREAAQCGLVVDLDLVTMTKALDALNWLPPEVSLHINLAPETLFAGRGSELLEVPRPERLVVEITEHSDIDDYRHLNRVLEPLREHGIRLAVDDVGAGFSSLRHVLVLEPDMIKLDVSLCRGIDSNQNRRAMARALTAFGHEVDKMVVAEGVETERELDALLELGVTHAQGYLLGRPDETPLSCLGPRP